MPRFRRYQSAVPNRRGTYPGVFALANGLAEHGLLDADDHAWLRAANRRAYDLHADPSAADPHCYDRDLNPGARAWFKDPAGELLGFVSGYLALLDRYAVPWVELTTTSPGRVVYEDAVQVVAVPYAYPGDWVLREQVRPDRPAPGRRSAT